MWQLRWFFYLAGLFVCGTIAAISYLEECPVGLQLGFSAFLILALAAMAIIYFRRRYIFLSFVFFFTFGLWWGTLAVLSVTLTHQRLLVAPIAEDTVFRIDNVGRSRKGKWAISLSVADGLYRGIKGIVYIPDPSFEAAVEKNNRAGTDLLLANDSASDSANDPFSRTFPEKRYLIDYDLNERDSIIATQELQSRRNVFKIRKIRDTVASTQESIFRIGDLISGDFLLKYRYERYWDRHFYGFGREGKFEIIPCEEPPLWWRLLRSNRQTGDYIVRMVGEGRETAVLKALVLGDKGDIPIDLKNAFAKSGASHFLALSGLHLGILMSVLVFIFSIFGHGRIMRIVRCIGVVTVLWAYSFFVALGVSIFRAVVMASFYELLRLFSRESSGFSALGLAGLVIVLCDPFACVQVGFQLSFSAVLGILVLSRYVHISVACQIFTAPLVWYYFGTFSHYYLLTNVLCMPLVSFVMGFAPVALLLGEIPGFGHWLAEGLRLAVWLLCYVVEIIASLPC